MVRLQLATRCPSLRFVLPVLNQMIKSGNTASIDVIKLWEDVQKSYVVLRVKRCKMYSYVNVIHDLASITPDEITYLRGLSTMYFYTDVYGSYIEITEDFRKNSMRIPEIFIESLDEKEELQYNTQFTLRKNFDELGNLVKVFNLLLTRDFYPQCEISEGNHFKIRFRNEQACRPVLDVGFGLYTACRNASENEKAMDIIKFNSIMARDNWSVGKFYYTPQTLANKRPSLEFRVI